MASLSEETVEPTRSRRRVRSTTARVLAMAGLPLEAGRMLMGVLRARSASRNDAGPHTVDPEDIPR